MNLCAFEHLFALPSFLPQGLRRRLDLHLIVHARKFKLILKIHRKKATLTGKFLAESMKTVNKAVLMLVSLNICVSANAAFKSLLSLFNCIHVNRTWTIPCFACSRVNHVSISPFLTTLEISTVALKLQNYFFKNISTKENPFKHLIAFKNSHKKKLNTDMATAS